MLSDRDIRRELHTGGLAITPPPDDSQLQPVSIDLRLGDGYCRFRFRTQRVALAAIPADLTTEAAYPDGGLSLYPGEFILATTRERITLAAHIAGRLEGKSTLGRLGLQVHSTAGLIDPGFDGCITLEISNVGPLVLMLQPGDLIGQLTLDYTESECQRPYGAAGLGSHYQGQLATTGPRGSREGCPA